MNFSAKDFQTGMAFFKKPSKSKLHLAVKFYHHTETDEFSGDLLEELKQEKSVEYILNADTGEIIFDR